MATNVTVNRYRPVVAPRLPSAPPIYDAQYQEQFMNILRLYFNQIDNLTGTLLGNNGGRFLRLPYGAFSDSTTQTQSATGTAKAITFNTTEYSNGVTIGTPTSRILITDPGCYNFQFSLQLDKASGSTGHTYIWPRISGTDVPRSASEMAIQGTAAENVAAWNFVLEMQAGQYFELMWSVDDTNVQIKAVAAAAPVPAIPSAILTTTFVSALAT